MQNLIALLICVALVPTQVNSYQNDSNYNSRKRLVESPQYYRSYQSSQYQPQTYQSNLQQANQNKYQSYPQRIQQNIYQSNPQQIELSKSQQTNQNDSQQSNQISYQQTTQKKYLPIDQIDYQQLNQSNYQQSSVSNYQQLNQSNYQQSGQSNYEQSNQSNYQQIKQSNYQQSNQTSFQQIDYAQNYTQPGKARSMFCDLPNDPNIVPITPDQANRGWAMSPGQTCTPGAWCPYACKPGMYTSQWDPNSKCTAGPQCNTMHGGLQCQADGTLAKAFPNQPLCSEGLGNVFIQSKLQESVSFCQTVYPGNEAMLIPTVAQPSCEAQTLNSPPSSYWLGTSAHYYVNPQGSTAEHCAWGSPSEGPFGNWAPYVVGVGQSSNSITYVSLTPNPNFPSVQANSSQSLYKISLTCTDCPESFTNPECFLDYATGCTNACTVGIPQGSSAQILLELS